MSDWHRKLNTILHDHGCGYSDAIFKIVDAAIAAEREACAQIAAKVAAGAGSMSRAAALGIESAIRARGEGK